MLRSPLVAARVRRTFGVLAAGTVALGTFGTTLAVSAPGAAAAPPSSDTTTYSPGTPELASITNGTSAAPWNTSQGDPGSSAYPYADLFPTYTPGGPTTSTGGATEPNLAVYPSATSGKTAGTSPYPSGVVGTPGPVDGYCGSGNNTAESSGSPVRQPNGTTLPFSPAYFPHIVRNSDGSLTGYFDERPKDTDESIVVARSTDNGKDWTYEGQALEENPGYCPTADINDDGEGHPNVITIGNTTYLYTLQRPAGDNAGVGLLVHQVNPSATDPLATVPPTEKVGVDPDAFATQGTTVPASGGTPATISLNQTGQANSPEQLVPGPFVDLTQTPTPTASSIINCTTVGTSSISGCTSANASGATIQTGDLIEQVVGEVSTAETIPKGPNNTLGTGGLANLPITFSNNVTSTILNNNAPNRVYVNGVPVYCNQANANQTTKLEDCTTGPGGSSLSAAVGAPVTSDPVVPATAQQTSGLVAPDGIVGVLPSYPGAPAGATIVMYTEKLLNYFMAGITNASGTYSSTSPSNITFFANPNTAAALPTPTPSSPVTVEVADDTKSTVIPATCTGLVVGSSGTSISSWSSPLIDSLTGCTVPTADNGDSYSNKDQIGAPDATLEASTTLAETGEGSTNQDKLYKNNEDLTLLRVAYTTNGINFSTAGLDNGGIISGQSDGASPYTDINDPTTTTDPPGGLNEYATPGTTDATEMRWVGSSGSIITNPDGSYGLFLSGAWGADGDSDAFNQIFYSSSTDGEHWTEPVSVVSTDYTFSASVAQDNALARGIDTPLGISAYYSGRAYGPSVVQNPNGSLTMVFSGYRSPKPIPTAGTTIGTNASAQWTVGTTDPALYRNILAVTLQSQTSPGVPTQTSLSVSPANPVAGQQVTYTATVSVPSPGTGTPTGGVTFTGDSGTLCTSAQATLSLGSPDTASCTTTYSGGAQSDSVTASYSGDSNYASSSSSALPVSIGSPLSLTKSTTSTGYGAAGDTIPYAYVVTDSGPDSLSGVSVSDNLVPDVDCPDSTLAPGASETCTGSYTVTQADVDAGEVTNTAAASATDAVTDTAVASPTSSVTVLASAATSSLTLTKSTTSTGYGAAGQTIPYTYLVTNTGTTTISNVSVSDDLVAPVDCPDSTLAPGASETCTGSYTVTQADVDTGEVTNTATAEGTNPQGTPVSSASSSVTVLSDAISSINLEKTTSSSGFARAGDVIPYSYLVTNTGATTLTDVNVSDDLVPTVDCPDSTLAPGASETCTGAYTVSQADVDAGEVTNTATAEATGPDSIKVSSPQASVTVLASGATSSLTLSTSTTSTGYGKAGDTIPFNYLVTNTGTTTLSNVSVSDDLVGGVDCPDSTLAPGASETCTGSYTVSQADVDAGEVVESSSASATDPHGDQVTAEAQSVNVLASEATSSLSLTKSTTSTGYGKAGDTIPYTYLVTNTGTTTMSNVSVSDDLVADVNCPDSTLAPGASETCTGSYTVTQADVDAGEVTNVAEASGTNPESTPVTSASASVTVYASEATSTLSLTKTSGATTFSSAGQSLPYSYTVTDTGTTTLHGVSVSDNLIASVSCPDSSLAPSASETCTGSYTVTQEDVDNGSVTNTATASADNPQDTVVTSNSSSVTVGYVGLKITTTSLPTLTLGTAYSDQLTSSSDIPTPVTWKAEAGLPKGLKLARGGLLSGTLSAAKVVPGTYSLAIEASQKVGPKKQEEVVVAFLSLKVVYL